MTMDQAIFHSLTHDQRADYLFEQVQVLAVKLEPLMPIVPYMNQWTMIKLRATVWMVAVASTVCTMQALGVPTTQAFKIISHILKLISL